MPRYQITVKNVATETYELELNEAQASGAPFWTVDEIDHRLWRNPKADAISDDEAIEVTAIRRIPDAQAEQVSGPAWREPPEGPTGEEPTGES